MTVVTSYESLQISQAHEHIQNSAAVSTQNISSNFLECCIINELLISQNESVGHDMASHKTMK